MNLLTRPDAGHLSEGLHPALRWFWGVLIALMGPERAKADTNSDSIAALRQLVEQQNRKLDELNEKVRLLEEREKQREAAPADQRLPAIVIDTNGIPIAPIAAGSARHGDCGQPRRQTSGSVFRRGQRV